MARITRSSLTSVPTSFATCSLSPEVPLQRRLRAISAAGFTGIEVSFPDLLSHAQSLSPSRPISPTDYPNLLPACESIRSLCASLNLQIMMLQPFANFEGHPPDSPGRADAFARARGWISLMIALGTDLLQVGSSDSPDISPDTNLLAADLRELADMLAEHGFRLAYENWCWATRAPGWKQVWEIVQLVGRDNVGLCLDTFQTAGGEWGDPTTESGVREDVDKSEVDKRWRASLEELSGTVPSEKVYLLQISDAYKPHPEPLSTGLGVDGLRPRGRWSHDYRGMIGKDGGYLPVREVLQAVLKTGFRGWLSVELFDGGEEGKEEREEDVEGYATECMRLIRKMLDDVAEGE